MSFFLINSTNALYSLQIHLHKSVYKYNKRLLLKLDTPYRYSNQIKVHNNDSLVLADTCL